MRNHSQVVAPLTRLTSLSVPFVWSPVAEEAFVELKRCLSSASILVQPDPSCQFFVEVDASDLGVGAVLGKEPKVTTSFICVPPSPRNFLLKKETIMSATGSC